MQIQNGIVYHSYHQCPSTTLGACAPLMRRTKPKARVVKHSHVYFFKLAMRCLMLSKFALVVVTRVVDACCVAANRALS